MYPLATPAQVPVSDRQGPRVRAAYGPCVARSGIRICPKRGGSIASGCNQAGAVCGAAVRDSLMRPDSSQVVLGG